MNKLNNYVEYIEFPSEVDQSIGQDEEYVVIREKGQRYNRKIRFHDYHEIYKIPGLYEYLFYEKLQCQSPEVICGLIEQELSATSRRNEDLVLLDVGAGNGMVGEALSGMGVSTVVGVDIIEEAAAAAMRDRPEVYDEYYVADLTTLDPATHEKLRDTPFNSMVTVSALGFGDIPPLAFAEAYNLVSTPGVVAFNIKDDFINGDDSSGFSTLIGAISESGCFEPSSQRRYRHRYSITGEPLYYVAVVGEKIADIPSTILEEFASPVEAGVTP